MTRWLFGGGQGLAKKRSRLIRLHHGPKSAVAVRLGVLWQPIRPMASDTAGRGRLRRGDTSLCRIVLVRRATAVRWAQPAGADGVTLSVLLLLIQVFTGLVLAGTDLFWPPFGSLFAKWVAAPGVDPTTIQPGASDLIDKAAYQSMRGMRAPFVEVHEIAFYALAAAIVLHLIAVVMTEVHEGGSITSAMFTGRKILTRKPPDAP